MNDMFSGCTNLRHIEFSDEKIEKVQNISYIFNHCISLEEINLSKLIQKMLLQWLECFNIVKI